jgi:arabinan endo-1,5-alpha-L-arabinosidase
MSRRGGYRMLRPMFPVRPLSLTIAALAVSTVAPAAAQEERRLRQAPAPRFHDPSTPVRHGDDWWVFSTGNGIIVRSSNDLRQWRTHKPVFAKMPAWHRTVVPDQRGHLWAPDIVEIGGRYLLYYSVSAWGKNTSAIGLATNATLNPADPAFEWKDEGIVIDSKREDPYNAIDPHLFHDDDGSLWMSFGSFWTGIQLIELDPETGKRHPENQEVHALAWNESIEAPAILKHDGYYHLFVNWGRCCRGLDSTYEIRIGRSRSITGPYVDKEGADLKTGGGTLLLASEGDQIGPGHPAFVAEEDSRTRMFFHYYDRRREGLPTLGSHLLEWTEDGWPQIARD